MTLEDFKDVYKDKTPAEMLDLLAEQHATWRHDAVAREENRDSIDGGAYYVNECRAMEARVEWIMGRLKDALKDQGPVKPYAEYSEHTGTKWLTCGACNQPMIKITPDAVYPNYCPECGRKVWWE